jgi:hypothetical protein
VSSFHRGEGCHLAALTETPETSSSKDSREAVDIPRNHDLAITEGNINKSILWMSHSFHP